MMPIELIKIRGTELHAKIYSLTIKVWEEEKMPEKWNMALYCPVHKKGDKTLCRGYRTLALLDVVHKVFSKMMSKRLEPYTEDVVGNYQAGFRRNKLATDQISSMKQILEKRYEYDIDVHCIFINFKQAFDSINRNELYKPFCNLGVPSKSVNLIKEFLTNTEGKIVIKGIGSEEFETQKGVKK
jgi:hypothetical protein